MRYERHSVRRWVAIVPIAMVVVAFTTTDFANLVDAGPGLTILLAVATLLVGVHEELMIRGLALRALRDRHREWAAAVWSSLIFGAFHLLNIVVVGGAAVSQAGWATVLGYLLYLCRRVGGGIWLPIGVHAIWDFSSFSPNLREPDAMAGGRYVIQFLVTVVLPIIVLVRRHAIGPDPGGDGDSMLAPPTAPREDAHRRMTERLCGPSAALSRCLITAGRRVTEQMQDLAGGVGAEALPFQRERPSGRLLMDHEGPDGDALADVHIEVAPIEADDWCQQLRSGRTVDRRLGHQQVHLGRRGGHHDHWISQLVGQQSRRLRETDQSQRVGVALRDDRSDDHAHTPTDVLASETTCLPGRPLRQEVAGSCDDIVAGRLACELDQAIVGFAHLGHDIDVVSTIRCARRW